jgi:alcohol dehydrogenase class IV
LTEKVSNAIHFGNGMFNKDLSAGRVVENFRKFAVDLEIPKLAAYGIGKDKLTDELIDAILIDGVLTTNPKQPMRRPDDDFKITLT